MKEMGVKPMGKAKAPVRKKAATLPKKKLPAKKVQPPRAEALERTLAVAKEERAAAEAKVTSLKKKLRRLKSEKAGLEEQISKPRPTIAETLTNWGFESADERSALMRIDGWLERIISHPSLEEDDGLRIEVEQTFTKVCEQCEPPADLTPIHVEPSRCSVCGGVDLAGAARSFNDAALLHGRLRVVIVGRSTMEHRMVRRWLGSDKRMVLTQMPGDIRRDASAAQTDVDHADAVIIWDENSLSSELLAVFVRSLKIILSQK